MSISIWLIIGLAIGGATGWLLAQNVSVRAAADPIQKHPPGVEEKDPYSLRASVLTPAQCSFYEMLRSVVPECYTVLLKVRVGDLVNVTYGAGNRQTAHARACSKSLDFLVCNPQLRPVVAIELSEGENRRSRESLVRILHKIGLPLETLPLRPVYDEEELRRAIQPHVNLGSTRRATADNIIAMSA